MAKVLILCPYPLNEAPSQRFRFEHFLPELKEKHEVDVAAFLDLKTWGILYSDGHWLPKVLGFLQGFLRRTGLIFKIAKYDIIFVHREEVPFGFPWISFAFSKILKRELIFDFDDAIWMDNVSDGNRKLAFLKNYKNPIRLMKWAKVCVGGNAFLSAFAMNYCADVRSIPSVISEPDTQQESQENNEQKLSIGWTGSHSTVKYLEPLYPVIRKLYDDGIPFYVISDKHPPLPHPPLNFIKWDRENEIEQLRKFEIGLMPLPDKEWAKGKCGFKIIQYMARGIIPVASSVGVNSELISEDRGSIIESLDEWESAIRFWLENSEDRINAGKAGKLFIYNSFSKQSQLLNFLHLFEL